MIRGTTPEYTLTVEGFDLTDQTVFVTVSQGVAAVTKTGSDISVVYDGENSDIMFSLTQQDTLSLKPGKASVQVRFIDAGGVAQATDIAELDVGQVLLERVIAYADHSA